MIRYQYGAHEVIELHEVLNAAIDSMNLLQVYASFARAPELQHLLANQIAFVRDEYNRLVTLVNGRGMGPAVPYRPQMSGGLYGGSAPVMVQPNASPAQMDDRDVASGVLGLHKAGASLRMHAALECADPQIRDAVLQGANNCAHQAYEVWGYMNRRGYYQIPTLQEMTTTQMLRGYQPATGVPHQPLTTGVHPDGTTESHELANPVYDPDAQPQPVSSVESHAQETQRHTVSTSPTSRQEANASQIFSSPLYRQHQQETSMTNPMHGPGAATMHPNPHPGLEAKTHSGMDMTGSPSHPLSTHLLSPHPGQHPSARQEPSDQ